MPCSWSNDYCSFGLRWFHGVTSIYFLKTPIFIPLVLGELEESWVIHYFLMASSSDSHTLSEGQGLSYKKKSFILTNISNGILFLNLIWRRKGRSILQLQLTSGSYNQTQQIKEFSSFSTQVYNSSPSCCWIVRLFFVVVVVRNEMRDGRTSIGFYTVVASFSKLILLWNDMTNSQTSWQVEHFSYIHFHWHLYVFIDLISSFCLNKL